MREIKDITKKEFLKAFNDLRFIWEHSVDLKELAGKLNIFESDLKRHIRNKSIDIGNYFYALNKNNKRIKRIKK